MFRGDHAVTWFDGVHHGSGGNHKIVKSAAAFTSAVSGAGATKIVVEIEKGGTEAVVVVKNNGAQIPQQSLDSLFDMRKPKAEIAYFFRGIVR